MFLSDSVAGLQRLINHTTDFLRECGMAFNNNYKSGTIALFGHRGNAVVDASATFNSNDKPMQALSREDPWT